MPRKLIIQYTGERNADLNSRITEFATSNKFKETNRFYNTLKKFMIFNYEFTGKSEKEWAKEL